MTNETYKMLIELLEFECDKYNNVKLKNRKEYNHEYYLKITKPKRKAKKDYRVAEYKEYIKE